MRHKVSVSLDDELYEHAKQCAAEDDRTLSSLIVHALRGHMSKYHGIATGRPRGRPRKVNSARPEKGSRESSDGNRSTTPGDRERR